MVVEFEDDSDAYRSLVRVGNVESVSSSGVVAGGARAVVPYALGRYFGELVAVVFEKLSNFPKPLPSMQISESVITLKWSSPGWVRT